MARKASSKSESSNSNAQVVIESRDNNANFDWVQHFNHHLASQQGMADVDFVCLRSASAVLANPWP